jgi:hypothetical protein
MSLVIIAIAFVVAGLIVGYFATATAPVGYEDESGFHFGAESGASQPATTREVIAAAQLSPKHA